MLLLPAAAAAKPAGPYYFTAVNNGAYDFKGGAVYLEDSYKALEKMVQLADSQHVRLTLLFSAQYAEYISSGTVRQAALEEWKKSGHEIGAYHQGPDTKAWDGYSDLAGEALARARGGKVPESVPGHAAYFAALGRLAAKIKTGCMAGAADSKFLAAAPEYELCPAEKAGLTPRGVNGFIFSAPGPGGGKKWLSTSAPSDRAGIEAAKKAFSKMEAGVYGAAFKSSPSEFGAFYAWLQFLKGADPQGVRSRTVAEAVEEKLVADKPQGAGKTQGAEKQARTAKLADGADAGTGVIPRLKPKPSPFSQVERLFFGRFRSLPGGPLRGSCGDGVCDPVEKKQPGRCARDCGVGK